MLTKSFGLTLALLAALCSLSYGDAISLEGGGKAFGTVTEITLKTASGEKRFTQDQIRSVKLQKPVCRVEDKEGIAYAGELVSVYIKSTGGELNFDGDFVSSIELGAVAEEQPAEQPAVGEPAQPAGQPEPAKPDEKEDPLDEKAIEEEKPRAPRQPREGGASQKVVLLDKAEDLGEEAIVQARAAAKNELAALGKKHGAEWAKVCAEVEREQFLGPPKPDPGKKPPPAAAERKKQLYNNIMNARAAVLKKYSATRLRVQNLYQVICRKIEAGEIADEAALRQSFQKGGK